MEELQAVGAAGRWKEEAEEEEEEEEDSSGRVEKAVEFKERMTPVSSVTSSTTLNGRSNEAAAATVEVRRGSFSSSSDPVRRQAVTTKKGRPPQLFSQAVAPSSTEQGGVFGNLSQRQDDDNDDVVKKKKLPAKQNPSTSTHDAPPHPQGGGLPRPTYRRPQQQQQQQQSSYDYDSSVGGAAAPGMTLKKKKKKEPAGVVVVPADQGFSMSTHARERSPSSSFFSNELGIPPDLQAPPDNHQDFSMITQAGERPPFDEFGIPLHLKASPDHHHQDFSMITQAGEKPSFDEFGIPLHLQNSSGGGRGSSRNIQDFSIITTHGGDDPDEISSFTDPRLFSSYQSSFNQRAGANGGYQDQYSTPDVGDVPLYKPTRPGKQQQHQQHQHQQQGLRRGHTMPTHHDKGQQQIGYWEALEAEEHAHPVMRHETRHHAMSLPRTARYQSSDNQIPEMYKRAPPHKFAESPRSPNFEAAPAPRRSPGPRYYEGPGHRENQSAMDSNDPDRFNTVQYGMRQNHRGKTSTQWKTENPDVVCCTIL
ncbi:unnamed protein product [Sphagnum compactum]